MLAIKKPYTPINCAFHDYLEHFATLKQAITIVFKNEGSGSIETIENAIITNLTGGRNGEFSHIKCSGKEITIRNDYLLSVGDIHIADYEDGACGI